MTGQEREDVSGGAGRIARFSIFAAGLVAGLILGLALTPSGYASAAREVAQFSNLCGAPTDQPMAAPKGPPPSQALGAHHEGPLLMASAIGVAPGARGSLSALQSPMFAPIPAGDHSLTVGVFGDSLADGLWAGLYRQMRDAKHFEVVKFSQVSTGLSRYDYVDVQARTESQLAQQHVDVAAILFGANDQQGIVEHGQVFAFGTPGWRDIYARRIDALVTTLRRQGATVYWVGLPKMRAEGFDRRAQVLNAIYQERMAALGVRFIPTDGATADVQGNYAAYLPIGPSGRMTLMRANDGIHMSMSGYLRIAEPVTSSIHADLNQRAGAAVSVAGLGR